MQRYIRAIKRIINNPNYFKMYRMRCISIIKLWGAYVLNIPISHALKKRELWLVREKSTEARDNGYHLFKYIRETNPSINVYYLISKDSPDLAKVTRLGNVIYINSLKHYLYYFNAKVSASSQALGAIPDPTEILFNLAKRLHRKDQIIIHLKHGITKDEMPHSDFDYEIVHYDLICCASERERKFVQETYNYPDDHVKAIGFCRFDNLYKEHKKKKQILIMPTHRMWLQALNTGKEATENELISFELSNFYKAYSLLLDDSNIIECAKKNGYTIVFYLHYALQSYNKCFEKYSNDTIVIANRTQYDVQQLLQESSLLITDYSSVFFDFAYMEKPVIFYQFDEMKYREGHYKKGYFDYRTDGFGPVFERSSDVILETCKLITRGCFVDEKYKNRIDDFFCVRDDNNCYRVFNEIKRKAILYEPGDKSSV